METDDLLLFVRVAELRSLTAAGRDLRLTPAVVSSRLIRLEKKLGMRLLNRTTRQVEITPDGHHLLSLLYTFDADDHTLRVSLQCHRISQQLTCKKSASTTQRN